MTNRLLAGATIALMAMVTACDAAPDRAAAGEADRPATDERTEAAAQTRSPAQVMPIDHSGVTGTAEADRDDDWVTVTLTLDGLRPGAMYLAHVHEGSCAAGGPARTPLGRIPANGGGTTTVELRADGADVATGEPWSVQIETETGEAVACADLLPQ
jgi:Cu/Zn superoxide dismutase